MSKSKLIELTTSDGRTIWVNPDHIVQIEEREEDTILFLTNRGETIIHSKDDVEARIAANESELPLRR